MKTNNKIWLIIGTGFAVLLIGAAIVWAFWKKKKDNAETTATKKPIKKPIGPIASTESTRIDIVGENLKK